jgi:hypothetical protein
MPVQYKDKYGVDQIGLFGRSGVIVKKTQAIKCDSVDEIYTIGDNAIVRKGLKSFIFDFMIDFVSLKICIPNY